MTRRGVAAVVLLAALVMPLLAMPRPALAASAAAAHGPDWRAMMHPRPMINSFWLTGEVQEVSDTSVKLLLEGRGHDHPMLRQFEWSVTLAVDEDSILLDADFNPLQAASLEVGTPVVFVPRMVWGTLGVRLLYTGSPDDLSDATYIGRATLVDDNTLTLERRGKDITVVVDENTIWYDDGKRGRPAELYEDTLVRLIGVEERAKAQTAAPAVTETGSVTETAAMTGTVAVTGTATMTETATITPAVQAGTQAGETATPSEETVVRAILITPGKRGF